jgi:hypothetical protein
VVRWPSEELHFRVYLGALLDYGGEVCVPVGHRP